MEYSEQAEISYEEFREYEAYRRQSIPDRPKKDNRETRGATPIQIITPPEDPSAAAQLDLTKIRDSDQLIKLRQQKITPWIKLGTP